MRKNSTAFILSLLALLMLMSLKPKSYQQPDNQVMTVYDSIVMMDKMWEEAYNNCKMDVMEDIISEDLEFYHDQGGLMTSKKKLNEALKNNICGKVKRELKKGSIEVYEIKGYGAVEMGMHGFLNINQSGPPEHYAKFVHLWKWEKGKWRITRVISLH